MKTLTKRLTYTIIASAIIITILFLFLLSYPSQDIIREVKCYDRYSNEIVGVSCEEKIDGVGDIEKILTLIFFSGVIIIINYSLSTSLFYKPSEDFY